MLTADSSSSADETSLSELENAEKWAYFPSRISSALRECRFRPPERLRPTLSVEPPNFERILTCSLGLPTVDRQRRFSEETDQRLTLLAALDSWFVCGLVTIPTTTSALGDGLVGRHVGISLSVLRRVLSVLFSDTFRFFSRTRIVETLPVFTL